MKENGTRDGRKLRFGVIAVFIVGVIIGGLSATALMRSHIIHVMRGGPPRVHERIAERLTGNLTLTSAQRAQIASITGEFEARFEDFEHRSRAEVREIADQMEARIREILTPDQQAKYDANIRKMHEEMKRMEHMRPGDHPKR